MSDEVQATVTPGVDTKPLHWKTRQRLEREAASSPSAPPATDDNTRPAEPADGTLSYEEFCAKFFLYNTREVLKTVQDNGVEDGTGAVVSLCRAMYSCYRRAMDMGAPA